MPELTTSKVILATSAMNVGRTFLAYLNDADELINWGLPHVGHELLAMRIIVEHVLPDRRDSTIALAEEFKREHHGVELVLNRRRRGIAANRIAHERWAIEYALKNEIPLNEVLYVVADPDGEMDLLQVPLMIMRDLQEYAAVIGCVHYTFDVVNDNERDWFKSAGPVQAALSRSTKPWAIPSPGFWIVRLDHLARMHKLLDTYREIFRRVNGHDFGEWGYPGAEYMLMAAAAEIAQVPDYLTNTVTLGCRGKSPNFALNREARRELQRIASSEHTGAVRELRRIMRLPAINRRLIST